MSALTNYRNSLDILFSLPPLKMKILLYNKHVVYIRYDGELNFKTWKSNLNFDKIHDVSEFQLGVLLHARLIMITLIYEKLYKHLELLISQRFKKQLSLMKFMRFISRSLMPFVNHFFDVNKKNNAIKLIVRYCTYEKRKRCNFFDLMELIYRQIELC